MRLAYCLYCTLHRGCIRLLVVSLLGLSESVNLLTIELRLGIHYNLAVRRSDLNIFVTQLLKFIIFPFSCLINCIKLNFRSTTVKPLNCVINNSSDVTISSVTLGDKWWNTNYASHSNRMSISHPPIRRPTVIASDIARFAI